MPSRPQLKHQIMRSVSVIVLALTAKACGKELSTKSLHVDSKYAQNSTGMLAKELIDKYVNNMFDRAMMATPIYEVELDSTTLGKPSAALISQRGIVTIPHGYSTSPLARSQFHTETMRGGYMQTAGASAVPLAQYRPQIRLEPTRQKMIPMAATQEVAQAPAESEVYKIEGDKLKADRYIAMNQFRLREGAGPKFEARWANRKSRLATLDGFKYFNLMRRVPVEGIVDSYDDDFSYVSFTIWENKPAFNAWRKGDAFKEAHGGTSIGAFLTTMVSSLLVLKGAPSPVFWDGLMHQSVVPESVPLTEGGWRVVEADGTTQLPTEAFIA